MNTLKKSIFSKTCAAITALSALLLLAGCTSPFGKENRAYIYVAENETITCLGQSFKMFDEVASFLVENGGTPSTVVIIVAQGEIPNYYLKSLVSACGHKGFTQVYIRSDLHASATVSDPNKANSGKIMHGTSNVNRDVSIPKKNKK